jgi:hypothetical protein
MVADGAGVEVSALGSAQTDAALGAGEFYGLFLLGTGVNGLSANGTLGGGSLALVKHYIIAAMGADTAGELVGAHINGMTAGAVDFLFGKKAGFCFHILAALGTRDYKVSHFYFSFIYP